MLSLAAIPPTPESVLPQNHIKLEFADIDQPDARNIGFAAQDHHIEAIIGLAKLWDGSKPLLVNCRQGHRRSPSATLIILCARHPGKEYDLYIQMKEKAPYINLNWRMITLADRLLAAEGRLVSLLALDAATGPPPRGAYFTL